MDKLPIKPGWIVVFVLCMIPVVAWGLVIPLHFRYTNFSTILTSLGQICGLVGLVLFSLAITLSARFPIYEKLFGGMNRVYIAHHLIGGSAFLFLLVHPILVSLAFVPYSLRLAIAQLLPSANWPANFGIAALAILMALLVFTFFITMPYQIWRLTHKFMGLALLLGGLHGLYMHSDVHVNSFLKLYFFILVSVALLLYLYRTILGRYLVKRYAYSVQSISNVSPQVVRVNMVTNGAPIKFLPGQFMFVSFDHSGFKETHPFSFSSSPNETDLAFTAKASGDWTAKLTNLPVNTPAKIEGPFGHFTYTRYENHKQIWIAGGIGITPFYSMAKAMLPDYEIHLYYALTDPSEAVYLDELKKSVKVVPWYSKTQGHISAEIIAKDHAPITAWDVFICGPSPMMSSLKQQFKALKLKPSQLHTEEFRID